jgi:hypothetical protein
VRHRFHVSGPDTNDNRLTAVYFIEDVLHANQASDFRGTWMVKYLCFRPALKHTPLPHYYQVLGEGVGLTNVMGHQYHGDVDGLAERDELLNQRLSGR